MRIHGYLALAVGVCLTAWTCMLAIDAQDARIRNDFRRDADKVAGATNVRLQIYFDMLLSIKLPRSAPCRDGTAAAGQASELALGVK